MVDRLHEMLINFLHIGGFGGPVPLEKNIDVELVDTQALQHFQFFNQFPFFTFAQTAHKCVPVLPCVFPVTQFSHHQEPGIASSHVYFVALMDFAQGRIV